jgi:imidazolonepropionase-like amidohydrolase
LTGMTLLPGLIDAHTHLLLHHRHDSATRLDRCPHAPVASPL